MAVDAPVSGGRMRTRGHDLASRAVRAMIAGRAPHALLIGGPTGVGKTTLALDLAAGLMCDDPDPANRPCRACRSCRLVDRGRHSDIHRLAPVGPGDVIPIGNRNNPDDGTVRRLVSDLVLLPVEGGARVVIIERADRLGDDAQDALLKTLEEPPAGVTIVLCADDEERLTPTIRSRCARLRLGPVAVRDVESILADADVADAPLAARLARLSGGRPGLARSLARSPDAVAARDEIARTLLHLLAADHAVRLSAARELVELATRMNRSLDQAAADAIDEAAEPGFAAPRTTRGGRARGRGATATGAGREPTSRRNEGATADSDERPATAAADREDGGEDDDEDVDAARKTSVTPAQRRRAAAAVVGLWRELARDLLVVRLGVEREVRDPALLDDLRAAAISLGPMDVPADDPVNAGLSAFLARLDTAGELLEANVRPELIVDTLLLAWPVAR